MDSGKTGAEGDTTMRWKNVRMKHWGKGRPPVDVLSHEHYLKAAPRHVKL